MKTKYRIINKSDNVIKCFSKPHDVAIFLLGRRVSNYIVIKSDDILGDRLVSFSSCVINDIEKALEA